MNQIEKRKASNGGKLPYGTISSIAEDNKEAFPWLDANKINYKMQKLTNIHDPLPIPAEDADSSMSLTPNARDISSLTEDELIENEDINIEAIPKAQQMKPVLPCHIA